MYGSMACNPREEDDTFTEDWCMSRNYSECLIQAIVQLKWTGKAFIWRHLNVVTNVILRSCFHQNQRYCSNHVLNAHFWAFWIGVLQRVYSKISMDATAFCCKPRLTTSWFWSILSGVSMAQHPSFESPTVNETRLFENKHGRNSVLL